MTQKTIPLLVDGKQFKVLRNQAHMTKYRLSRLSGVAEQTIGNFESKNLNPTISTYRKLIEALANYMEGRHV